MNQTLSNFESIHKTVCDLKRAIEPHRMWTFKNLSTIQGCVGLLQDIENDERSIFLTCEEVSQLQKLALKEMSDNVKTIQPITYGFLVTINVKVRWTNNSAK